MYRDLGYNRLSSAPPLSHRPPSKPEPPGDKEAEAFRRLPSIPRILEKDRERHAHNLPEPNPGSIFQPPLSTTRKKEGAPESTHHDLIRASMYVVPADEDLFDLIGLPLLVCLQPFAASVAVPEYRVENLVQCISCRAFPSISTGAQESGRKFSCRICAQANDTVYDAPSMRHHTLDFTGNARSILEQRHWYTSDALPKTECVALPPCRKWKEPCIIFGVDISSQSKSSLEFGEYVGALRRILVSRNLSLFYRRVGVVLFGDAPIVVSETDMGYALSVIESVEQERSLCGPLLLSTDNFTPENVQVLISLIEAAVSHRPDTSSGITTCIQLAAYTGGAKLLLWAGSGMCAQSRIQDRFSGNSAKIAEKTDRKSAEQKSADMRALRQAAVDCGMSVHLFVPQNTELDCLLDLVGGAGGSIVRGSPVPELEDRVMRETQFRCAVRIICSDGIKKRTVYSGGTSENISTTLFPEMGPETSLAASFSVDDFLKEGAPVYVQSIVEYVGMSGEYRIRVMNLQLRASRIVQQVFIGLAFDAMFAGMCKYVFSDPTSILENTRKAESAIVTALAMYKRTCAKESSSSQLVLPEPIKGLPVLIQSILKFPQAHLSLEIRKEKAVEILPLSVERTFRMFYPRLIKLSSLFCVSDADALIGERLSMLVLEESETYLLENGSRIVLWFGRGSAAFAGEIQKSEVLLGAISRLRDLYGENMPLVCCTQGTQDADFIGYMVEDQMGGYPKYQEYLSMLHSKILRR